MLERLAAAQGGDTNAFSEITEPFRYELRVHCYRILGSLQDAEDAVQETLLRAWRRLETYEGRASVRAWLYKIATNVCLDSLDKQRRRLIPTLASPPSSLEDAARTLSPEVEWLEPCPDEWFSATIPSPEARYSTRESMSLAFLAALQLLNPRQRAILILRDVLDWQASEVADLLETTVSSVNNVLRRARSTLHNHFQTSTVDSSSQLPADPTLRDSLERYMRAWETADIAALVSLLKEDAILSMPPIPTWFRGRDIIEQFISRAIFPGRAAGVWAFKLIRANGQPALALYEPDQSRKTCQAHSIQLLRFEGHQLAEITIFRQPDLFPSFALPLELKM